MWHSPPIPKARNPETDFYVYIFMFRVNGFVSRIRQTKFEKYWNLLKWIWCVHFYVPRNFFVSSIRQTQFEKYQNSWNGFWCIHFYVLRKFFRFTYTPNANLNKYKNFLKRILMCVMSTAKAYNCLVNQLLCSTFVTSSHKPQALQL